MAEAGVVVVGAVAALGSVAETSVVMAGAGAAAVVGAVGVEAAALEVAAAAVALVVAEAALAEAALVVAVVVAAAGGKSHSDPGLGAGSGGRIPLTPVAALGGVRPFHVAPHIGALLHIVHAV